MTDPPGLGWPDQSAPGPRIREPTAGEKQRLHQHAGREDRDPSPGRRLNLGPRQAPALRQSHDFLPQGAGGMAERIATKGGNLSAPSNHLAGSIPAGVVLSAKKKTGAGTHHSGEHLRRLTRRWAPLEGGMPRV
jgi:hypothetical protein